MLNHVKEAMTKLSMDFWDTSLNPRDLFSNNASAYGRNAQSEPLKTVGSDASVTEVYKCMQVAF